jgi:hypothetical protein
VWEHFITFINVLITCSELADIAEIGVCLLLKRVFECEQKTEIVCLLHFENYRSRGIYLRPQEVFIKEKDSL